MNKKQLVQFIGGLGIIFFLSVPIFAFAQAQITISSSVPGTYQGVSGTSGPGSFVADFYQFALIIGGILAFGMIVYGGVRYMSSAGNPSGASEAKEAIEAALLGLLLLAGAYFVLEVINPQLLNIYLPTLHSINIGAQQGTSGGGSGGTGSGGGTTSAGIGCAGGICAVLPNCTVSANTNCGGAPAMATVLSCVNQSDPNYTVNEGYPPTVGHSDQGHNTGCAIDVHVSSCAAGSAFMSAAQSCGASKVLNEYSNCGGQIYSHTTGGNIHIDAPKGQGGC